MKYIPLVGIGFIIWGLVTFDWLKVGLGLFLFFSGFLIDLSKKKGVMKDDKAFVLYKSLSEIIRIIRKSIEAQGIDLNNPKLKLAQGLFFLGMLDAASQAANMDDRQFLNLFKAIFTDLDYDFDQSYQSKLLLFHQSLITEHGAFPAIIKGGDLFAKFANGNRASILAGGMLIKELIEDPKFPASVDAL